MFCITPLQYKCGSLDTCIWVSLHQALHKEPFHGPVVWGEEIFSGFLLLAIYFTPPYLLMAELVDSEANEA